MQSYGDKNAWTATGHRWRLWGVDASKWAFGALGVALTFAATHLLLVQPTARQLRQMQEQLASLEANVDDLAGQRGTVATANSLLAQLQEQGRRNDDASRSLNRIATLHERLNQQTERAEQALLVMEKLASLQDGLLDRGAQINETDEVLNSIEALESRLIEQYYPAKRSHLALDALDQLRNRLIDSQATTADASASLDEIDLLTDRLNLTQETTAEAQQSLSDLVELQHTALAQAPHVEEARDAIESLVDLKNWLLWSGEGLAQAQDVMRAWLGVQRELTEAAAQTHEARATANRLLAMSDELVCGGDAFAAMYALESLVAIRERLDDQGTGVELAQSRVDQFIDLKDRTISQSADVPLAIESLELLSDVEVQLSQVAQSFGRMRQVVNELLSFEPVFNRAMRTLQPLAELGNLRHLSVTDLRRVVQSISECRDTQFSASPSTDGTESAETNTVPAVVESARAH